MLVPPSRLLAGLVADRGPDEVVAGRDVLAAQRLELGEDSSALPGLKTFPESRFALSPFQLAPWNLTLQSAA